MKLYHCCALALAGLALAAPLRAQLAITEVMTSEAVKNYPDWWELKNFGTNTVNLDGYAWNDDSHGGLSGGDTAPFVGLSIGPGEVIVFVEPSTLITSAADFRTWWGLGPSVKVVLCSSAAPGLGASGDSVRLWSTNGFINGVAVDAGTDYLVDRVDVGAALSGRTLVYDISDGLFDVSSTNGVAGAFQAATQSDVGSPGVGPAAPGPVRLVQQPTNSLVPTGLTATLTAMAYGLPKPRFQWLFNGLPVDTNRVSIAFTVTNNYCLTTLTLTNAQPTNAGIFQVVAANGFDTVSSTNALLTVNGNPLAPYFAAVPPAKISAYPGQALTFNAPAFGNPPPGYQWKLNGTNLDSQTQPQFQLSISDTNQSGTYTISVTNSTGSTNASVVLLVTPKPNLRITEIQSSEATNAEGKTLGHNDWWELSNLGLFAVNIQGYRFDDDSYSLAQACTITNDITVAPGESIVLVEDMTADDFRSWWGASQLPPALQIVSYHGSGLSFSSAGDALTVWNGAAATESDSIDSVSISAATTGVSFGFDPANQLFLGYGPDGLSLAGTNGGIVAAVNGDIGSPGMLLNWPHFTELTPTNGGIHLAWFTQPNTTSTVQYKTNLSDRAWQNLTALTAVSNRLETFDPTPGAQRFYRVRLSP